MIKKPAHGWCTFELGDFKGTPSYLTDVPMELLSLFLRYFSDGQSICDFDEEGSSFSLILNGCSIYIIEEDNQSVLHDFSDFDVSNLASELIKDIEADKEAWIDWLCYDEMSAEERNERRKEIEKKIRELSKVCG